MNAMLNIRIVASGRAAAAQINAVASSMNNLNRASNASGGKKGAAGFFEGLRGSQLLNAGKNLQWVGRQLVFNFTLPLAAAGAAAFKFSQDIERSMVNVRKVYGDLTFSTQRIKEETDALARSFELLSSRFGVNQKEVVDIAAAWASAGSAGRGLAESVKGTLEAMIIGDMDAAKATEGLISIMATWGLTTTKVGDGVSDLTAVLGQLNIIENQTGVTFRDLIDILARAGGVARESGMSIRELAAFSAALVPAAGSASQAGNALKTIISRLQAPTKDTVDILAKMGITVASPEWLGKTATQKLLFMSEKFNNLSQANKTLVSSVVASRWQVNKFSVLMDDVGSKTGFFARAMEATADQTLVNATYQKELLTVLESSPRKWDIMVQTMKNALSKAFLPMIPVIMQIMGLFTRLFNWFAGLPEQTRQWILLGLAIVALVGPVAQILGAFMELGAVLKLALGGVAGIISKILVPAIMGIAKAFAIAVLASLKSIGMLARGILLLRTVIMVGLVKPLMAAFAGVAAALGLPIWVVVAIVAAAVAAILLILNTDLEKGVWDVMRSIGRAIWALPRIFAQALGALFRVVQAAVMQVWEMLSYLNPFATHSPSLVDNVTAGVDTILSQYGRLRGIVPMISSAAAALQNFNAVTAPSAGGFRANQLQALRTRVAEAQPSAGPAADAMIVKIRGLESALPGLAREIANQAAVVARWDAALEAANAALDAQEEKLEAMERMLSAIGDQIERAEDRLQDLASTPIAGMRALDDQIFANTMSANRLRLQLLQFEQAGQSIDAIRDKYAKLQGEIEILQGKTADLRMAGAGSEVLGVFEDQITALKGQKAGLRDTRDEIEAIQDQLDQLDLANQILELQRSITFDPLIREIDRLVNGVNEMSFDDIVAGIREQQEIVRRLKPEYDRLADAVEREKEHTDAVRLMRDAIAKQADRESKKLDQLKSAYSDIEQLIRDMESAMEGFASASEAAKKALEGPEQSRLEEMFDAGAGVDFPIQGSDKILSPEGTLADIEAFNKEMEDELARVLSEMGKGFDILKPIKDMWKKATDWLKVAWQATLDWLIKAWQWTWARMKDAGAWIADAGRWIAKSFMDWVVDPLVAAWHGVAGAVRWVWDNLIFPVFQTIAGVIYVWLVQPFQRLADIIKFVWEKVIAPVIEFAWSNVILPVFKALYTFIDAYIVPIMQMLAAFVAIYWKLIGMAIMAAWEFVIKPVFNFLIDHLGDILPAVFNGFKSLVQLVWDFIGTIISFGWNNIIKPVFTAMDFILRNVVGPAFTWIKDVIIKPIWDAIGAIITTGYNTVMKPIFEAFKIIFETAVKPAFDWLKSTIKTIWDGITDVIAGAWNTIATIIEGGVNFFIRAFNLLAGAVNKVSSFLKIDIKISEMPLLQLPRFGGNSGGGSGGAPVRVMAAGGVIGRAGGRVAGARALVGEGSDIYPEYVVPTDPSYRPRAVELYRQLGKKLFADDPFGGDSIAPVAAKVSAARAAALAATGGRDMGVAVDYSDRHKLGGWGPIGWAFDQGKKAVGAALDFVSEKALLAIWNPIKWSAGGIINQIPIEYFKLAGRGVLEMVDDWVRGADDSYNQKVRDRASQNAALVGQLPGGPSTPAITYGGAGAYTGPVHKGPGSWQIVPRILQAAGVPYVIMSTFRPGARTKIGNNPSMHGQNRAIDIRGPQYLNHGQMYAINSTIYKALKPHLHEMIFAPPSHEVYRGRDHVFSAAQHRDHQNHVHISLARGGRFKVPRTPGGIMMQVAEGRNAEQVQVMPLTGSGRDGQGGGDTYIFEGDLSFPNVRDGSDAEDFLNNLKSLVSNR